MRLHSPTGPGKWSPFFFFPPATSAALTAITASLVLQPEKYADFPWEVILEGLKKRQGWIDGVCLTGGEPTLHSWLPQLIRELKSNGGFTVSGEPLGIKLDTNGTHPEVLKGLIDEGLLDYVAMDLKGPLRADRYSALTGVPIGEEQMERIQASIQILLSGKGRLRISHHPGPYAPRRRRDLYPGPSDSGNPALYPAELQPPGDVG